MLTIYFLTFSLSTYSWTHVNFFQNILRVNCNSLYLLLVNNYFLKTRLFSYITIVQLSKSGNWHWYNAIVADLVQLPLMIPVMSLTGRVNSASLLVFTCLVLLSGAVGCYWVFVFDDLWCYLMRIGQLFLEFPQYGFVCCCFMIRFRSCIFGRNTPEVILCPLEAHDVHLSH